MTDVFDVSTATDISFLDEAPYRCETCGTALHYGGRGRKPRFCDEHKKGGASKSPASLKALEASLTEMYMGLGFGVTMLDQYDGQTITASAESLAHSWIVLAEANPKVKKFLQKLTTGGGAGAVIIAHAMVGVPILMHHGIGPFAPKDDVAR